MNYTRVSTNGQKDDLKNQIEFLLNFTSSKGIIGLMSIFWTQKVKLFYAALLANNSH